MPRCELDLFLTTDTDAIDLARVGEAAGGYEMLLAGLYRATEAHVADAAWGEESTSRYGEAVERFSVLYAIGRA